MAIYELTVIEIKVIILTQLIMKQNFEHFHLPFFDYLK